MRLRDIHVPKNKVMMNRRCVAKRCILNPLWCRKVTQLHGTNVSSSLATVSSHQTTLINCAKMAAYVLLNGTNLINCSETSGNNNSPFDLNHCIDMMILKYDDIRFILHLRFLFSFCISKYTSSWKDDQFCRKPLSFPKNWVLEKFWSEFWGKNGRELPKTKIFIWTEFWSKYGEKKPCYIHQAFFLCSATEFDQIRRNSETWVFEFWPWVFWNLTLSFIHFNPEFYSFYPEFLHKTIDFIIHFVFQVQKVEFLTVKLAAFN